MKISDNVYVSSSSLTLLEYINASEKVCSSLHTHLCSNKCSKMLEVAHIVNDQGYITTGSIRNCLFEC